MLPDPIPFRVAFLSISFALLFVSNVAQPFLQHVRPFHTLIARDIIFASPITH